jgi:hypothetical protein
MDHCSEFDAISKDYPWPASRLTKGDMMRLTELRERRGVSITKLLHEAVGLYYGLLNGGANPSSLCCENPQLQWRGSREKAAIACMSCGFVLADDGHLIDWHDPEQIASECEAGGSRRSIGDCPEGD